MSQKPSRSLLTEIECFLVDNVECVSNQGQDGTFRVSWNEVHGSSLGSQVFSGAVDPDVHALDLVGRNTQLHVPVGK